MGVAYDVATAVIAKINEETTMPVEQSMSAEKVESIINAKLESFSKAVEGLAEMTKAIAENNKTLVNELSSLKSDFETFKAQPSVQTKSADSRIAARRRWRCISLKGLPIIGRTYKLLLTGCAGSWRSRRIRMN